MNNVECYLQTGAWQSFTKLGRKEHAGQLTTVILMPILQQLTGVYPASLLTVTSHPEGMCSSLNTFHNNGAVPEED